MVLFVAGAIFGEVGMFGVSLFVAGAIFGEVGMFGVSLFVACAIFGEVRRLLKWHFLRQAQYLAKLE